MVILSTFCTSFFFGYFGGEAIAAGIEFAEPTNQLIAHDVCECDAPRMLGLRYGHRQVRIWLPLNSVYNPAEILQERLSEQTGPARHYDDTFNNSMHGVKTAGSQSKPKRGPNDSAGRSTSQAKPERGPNDPAGRMSQSKDATNDPAGQSTNQSKAATNDPAGRSTNQSKAATNDPAGRSTNQTKAATNDPAGRSTNEVNCEHSLKYVCVVGG